MELRVAMVPVAAVRAAGRDVRVARFAASPHCAYAMFAGGGLTWVETEAKKGDYALAPAAPGAQPIFPISPAAGGSHPQLGKAFVLSVIVMPRGEDARFAALVEEVVAMALGGADRRRLPSRLRTWARAGRERRSRSKPRPRGPPNAVRASKRGVSGDRESSCWPPSFHTFKLKAGKFDAFAYASESVADNADFPQVRRRPADDARLHPRIRRRARGAACRRRRIAQ